MADTIKYENKCCPRCGCELFTHKGEMICCTSCGTTCYPSSLKVKHVDEPKEATAVKPKSVIENAGKRSSPASRKPLETQSAAPSTKIATRLVAIYAAAHAVVLMAWMLLLFLSPLFKIENKEDYSVGIGHGGTNISDRITLAFRDLSGASLGMVIALMVMTILLIAASVFTIFKSVKAERSSAGGSVLPRVILGSWIALGVFMIAFWAGMPYIVLDGRNGYYQQSGGIGSTYVGYGKGWQGGFEGGGVWMTIFIVLHGFISIFGIANSSMFIQRSDSKI